MSLICRFVVAVAVAGAFAGGLAQEAAKQPVVAGYVFTRGKELKPGQIDVRGMTRINYAFANVVGGR